MTEEEKLDYVLNLFKTNKMDMQLSTIKGLIPEKLKVEITSLLESLVKKGYLDYKNNWWSGTKEGKKFQGFGNTNE